MENNVPVISYPSWTIINMHVYLYSVAPQFADCAEAKQDIAAKKIIIVMYTKFKKGCTIR
jgi:hypothetical protein